MDVVTRTSIDGFSNWKDKRRGISQRNVRLEKRAWLTAEEFTEMLAFCQFLPGPNIVNIAITVGARCQGPLGAMAALLGLILPAFCIVIALGALYARYGSLHMLRGLFAGIAAAAAGLIVAMTAKMAVPLVRSRALTSLFFMSGAFIMVGLLSWPLGWVLLGLAPMSIAATWWSERWRASPPRSGSLAFTSRCCRC